MVTITPVEDAPVANDDSAITDEDVPVTIVLLANDVEVDGDTLAITTVTTPSIGTTVVNGDNSITYQPLANIFGSDTFTYTVVDGNGGSDTAVVSVTIAAVNDAPVAVDDSAFMDAGTAVTITVLANDSDIDGDPLTVVTATQPVNGVVALNLDNSVTYTPTAGFRGSDSFNYTISDGTGGTDTATVFVSTPIHIDAYLDLTWLDTSYDPTPISPYAPAGVYTLDATFQNTSTVALSDIYFEVMILSGGNVLLNADGGPGGVGAILSVPATRLSTDGILQPGESFDVVFEVGLATPGSFDFFVDAYGQEVMRINSHINRNTMQLIEESNVQIVIHRQSSD